MVVHQEYMEMDWSRIMGEMANPIVIDGRNVIDRSTFGQASWKLYSPGKGTNEEPDYQE